MEFLATRGEQSPRALAGQMQKRNLANLYAEFRDRPPRYIAVLDNMTRGPSSSRVTDVPGFDDYLRDSCDYSHSIAVPRWGGVIIYRCRTRERPPDKQSEKPFSEKHG